MTRTLLAWLILGAFSPVVLADIEVRQVRLGFPAEGVSGDVYRGGAWCPAAIEVVLGSEDAPLNVWAHIEQWDLDGDIVFQKKFVGLSPGIAGRIEWLYFVPNPDNSPNSEGFKLQLLDAETLQPLFVTYNQQRTQKIQIRDLPELLSADTYLVLSIGEGTAGYVKRLSDFGEPEPRFNTPVRVGHISPDRVPDHWHGLEMVDAIVWDNADPSGLSENQISAIEEWVKQGGRLIIAASRTADVLAGSRLHDLLPVQLKGDVDQEKELPERFLQLRWDRPEDLDVPDWEGPPDDDDTGDGGGRDSNPIEAGQAPSYIQFKKPVNVAQASVRPEAVSAITSAAGTRTYAARRDLDRGAVVFSAITFQDLFQQSGDPEEFFKRALWLRPRDPSIDAVRLSGMQEPIELIEYLRGPIDFKTSATLILFIIITFVVVYGLVATFGTWFVLKHRGLQHYSWPAFGLVAAAASLVSLAAIRVNAGLGRKLDQITILDSSVDTYLASARCYFGLKTSTMVDMDVWLPMGWGVMSPDQPSDGYLRPMSPRLAGFQREERFADTQRYESSSRYGVLNDVPFRATLKQFEGFWEGAMSGQLHASIQLERRTGAGSRIAPGSTITNNLGYDLQSCFLLETPPGFSPEYGSTRNGVVLVHYAPMIADGEVLNLDAVLFADPTLGTADGSKLRDLHKMCLGGLHARLTTNKLGRHSMNHMTAAELAVLLLSTFAEYSPEASQSFVGRSDPDLWQTNCRWLDRSFDLRPDQMLLIGFAREPGPVKLMYRRGDDAFDKLAVRQGTTVHRFTIPVSIN